VNSASLNSLSASGTKQQQQHVATISQWRFLCLDPTNHPKECQHEARTAKVMLGEPTTVAQLMPFATQLEWVQSTWAGVEPLVKAFNDTAKKDSNSTALRITKPGAVFGRSIAEYVCGMILQRERQLPALAVAQAARTWQTTYRYRPLADLTVGILGASGEIGSQVGRALSVGFGCRIAGFASRARSAHGDIPVSKWYYSSDDKALSTFLAKCDYIVNTLPSTAFTVNLLGGTVLSACKNTAIFINVGRGNIITDASLEEALRNRWIGGAILDVFNTEPLPLTSALWSMPNVVITPHVAGPSSVVTADIVDFFLSNLHAFSHGLPLSGEVDPSRGY